MYKHTYYAGGKPAVERLVMDFDKKLRRLTETRLAFRGIGGDVSATSPRHAEEV